MTADVVVTSERGLVPVVVDAPTSAVKSTPLTIQVGEDRWVELDEGGVLFFADQAVSGLFKEWLNLGVSGGRAGVGQVQAWLVEAAVRLAQVAQAVESGDLGGPRTLRGVPITTVLEWFEGWIGEDVARGRPSPHTVRNYLGDTRQFLVWLELGRMSPADAVEATVVEYRAWLSSERQLKAATVNRKLVSVRQFYAMALRRNLVRGNPCDGVKGPVDSTAAHARRKCLGREELKRLLRAPDRQSVKGLRDLTMLVLMGIHGLRVVEVERLDLESVDWGGGQCGALNVHGKRDKYRRVFLTGRTRTLMKAWLEQRRLIEAVDEAGQEGSAMFVSLVNGKPCSRLSRRSIRSMVDGYLLRVGAKRPGVSCHALRHTFATQVTAADGRLEVLSLTMGHSSVTTTQVYQDMVSLMKENPADLIDDLLEGVI